MGDLLVPCTLSDMVLVAPVRTDVWFFLPCPISVPNWATLFSLRVLLASNPMGVMLFGADLPALLSTWMLIGPSPVVAAAVFARRTWHNLSFPLGLLNLGQF